MSKKGKIYQAKKSGLAARRQRARLVVGILILIIFASLLFSLSWFLSQPFVVINEIAISGNSLIATKDLLTTTEKVLAGSYFGLFTKSNILLYPEKKLEKTLTATFPAIKNIRGNLENWQTLKLTLEEKTPIALWCPTVETTECFYLDENGLIFAPAPIFSENIFIKFTGSLGNSSVGQNFMPTDKFRSINFFLNTLTSLGLIPTIFEINAGTYQIYIKNKSKLIINATDDLSVIIKNLETILRSNNLKGALNRGGEIDYIDLRYGSKVFYKFKTEN